MTVKRQYVSSAIVYQPEGSSARTYRIEIGGQGQGNLSNFLENFEKEELQALRADELKDKIETRRLEALKKKMEIQEEINQKKQTGSSSEVKDKDKAKRFTVDPQTGVIDIDEVNGEYTQKDALVRSASIKAQRGEFDPAINLINAAKELTKVPEGAKEEKPKKWWYVTDDGVIEKDEENGDLTLSEARAKSESMRRALIPAPKEEFTPEKFELMKRDLKDALNASLDQSIAQIRSQLTPKEQEALFTVGEDGQPVLNPRARMDLNGFLLLQMWQNMGKKTEVDRMYKDAGGNVLPLPDWITFKKFEGEEHRKEDMHKAVVGLIEEGRKRLPEALQALKNMATSPEATKALEESGWLPTGGTGVKSGPCPGCHEPITYADTPAITRCGKCGTLAVFGSPEEQKQILDQLAGIAQKPAETPKEDASAKA
jgi:hypothetical protein